MFLPRPAAETGAAAHTCAEGRTLCQLWMGWTPMYGYGVPTSYKLVGIGGHRRGVSRALRCSGLVCERRREGEGAGVCLVWSGPAPSVIRCDGCRPFSFVRWRLAGAVAAERAGHGDMGTPSTRTCWKPEVQRRRAAAVGGGSSAWALGREAWEARYLAAGKRF